MCAATGDACDSISKCGAVAAGFGGQRRGRGRGGISEAIMELGMVGLGRMGANMVERLVRGGHRLVGYDRDAAAVARVIAAGAEGADSLASLAGKLARPRAVWIMVPSGAPVDETIATLLPHLSKDDILIDGGNSTYKDTQRRAAALKRQGVAFADVGTSGGVWGLKGGDALMG